MTVVIVASVVLIPILMDYPLGENPRIRGTMKTGVIQNVANGNIVILWQ